MTPFEGACLANELALAMLKEGKEDDALQTLSKGLNDLELAYQQMRHRYSQLSQSELKREAESRGYLPNHQRCNGVEAQEDDPWKAVQQRMANPLCGGTSVDRERRHGSNKRL